jgi:hypothetical protein
MNREIAELRNLLWNEWDPIGVRGRDGWPREEYDTYVDGLSRRLDERQSLFRLARYLHTVRTRDIGMLAHPIRDIRVARKARRWYRRG